MIVRDEVLFTPDSMKSKKGKGLPRFKSFTIAEAGNGISKSLKLKSRVTEERRSSLVFLTQLGT